MPVNETPEIKLGDRVVWRSSSHRYWAEKVGIVIFLGEGGWHPERAPDEGWLDTEWRDTVRKRRPSYEERCRLSPAPDGRGYIEDPKVEGTSRQRFRFEKCNGVLVAVDEYVQLNLNTQQRTLERPKRPVFYSPRRKARKGASALTLWPEGEERPEFESHKVEPRNPIEARWEDGVPHDPRSQEIYEAVAHIDRAYGKDRFMFRKGGDGDNGEHLMYLLDLYFEYEDQDG